MPARTDPFIDEVESGDRLRALRALRLELARGISRSTDGAELSSLALRLTRVLEQIDELGGQGKEEDDDDLADRRRRKLSAAADA